ncbi:PKD domain-containing protein, partial [Thermodesulfovibrionales bacterium]|nr:PKD domain-containing protein [Thermodesulfovibrionales bacterium]
TSPADNERLTTASVTVRGTATDAGQGDSGINRVEVNNFLATDGTATGSGTANWHKTISLSPGANTITVVAFDNSPRQNSTTQTITVHYEPPTISARIDSYSPNTKITVERGTPFDLRVWFTNTGDAGHFYPGVTIWDGPPGDPNRNEVFDQFGARTHLAKGAQGSYTWTATLNNVGEYWLQFGMWNKTRTEPILDRKPFPSQNLIQVVDAVPEDTLSPSLTITTPAHNERLTTESVTVRGTASDAGRGDSGISKVKVNGFLATDGTATGSGTANWHKTISLSPGANTITVVAFDNSPRQNKATQTISVYFDPLLQISARIDAHTVDPRSVVVGESVTVGFTFTNTGNTAHTFGAGATLRRDGDDATRINFLEAVTVAPGEIGSAQWTHTIDTAGKWEVVFGVWEESTHPLENLVVETGWVDEYITATDVLLEQGKPVLSAGLQIAPEKDTYFVGGVLTANFSVTNIGNKPITFDKLLVGGRFNYGELPEGGYPDFTMQQFVTVAPGEIHCYKGTLKLRHPGKYNFFVAFYIANPTPEEKELLNEDNWGVIELGEGVVGDATKQMMVRGFHPYPHGFSFDNDTVYSGGWGPGCKMRIFINVYDLTGVDTRTQSEFFWRLNFGEGGNCFGMAVAELMEYRYPDRDYLVETELYNLYMQRDFIFYLSSDGFEEYIGNRTQWTAQGNIQERQRSLMKHIVGFQISWRGIDHARRIDGIQNVLNTLRNVNFSGASPEKYVIAIWDEGSGHALIPYKLVRVNENTYKLYVHDSNHPSPGLNSPGRTDQRITFERDCLGRWLWKYLMWTRDCCGTEVWWSGRGETISLIPISLIHNEGRKLRIPGTGAEDGYIALCGEANLLLTDAEGRIAGIKDGEIFEEIPDVQLVFPMGAIPEKEPARWAPTFYLSDEVADIDPTFTVQGITYEEEPFSLIRFGPGYFVEFDSKIEPGAKSEIQILERGTKVIISDHNREYDLVLNKNDNGISRTFTVTDIAVSDEAKHQFTIAWDAFIREEEAVTLKIDADGDGIFEEEKILQSPIATFTYSPEEMIAGQPITFDASGSSDPDGQIISYEWDFGDGTSRTGKVVEHTFALAGDYTVTLTITDNHGVVNTSSKIVTARVPDPDPDPADDANGCFIATAAFGTPLAEEIDILREFRDEYLLTNELGQRFVAFYNRHSPALAEFIAEREAAKKVVRVALWPLVKIVEFIVGEEREVGAPKKSSDFLGDVVT